MDTVIAHRATCRRAWRGLAIFAAAALAAAAGPAPGVAPALEVGPEAVVSEVVDGDTLVLEDGSQVRLVGIQAPKLPLGRPDFRKWPLADEAKAALAELTLGKRVRLAFGGQRSDRYRRHLAHLYDPEGHWIQGALLRRGLARVYSFRDNRALVAEMLAAENEARAARRGIWAHPYYQVRTAAEAGRFVDGFELVEGRVLAVAQVRGRTYLNFGPDWRSDFTVTIERPARRLFENVGLDPAALEGRRVRVRGWLKFWNGPMIAVTHPEQIEVLQE